MRTATSSCDQFRACRNHSILHGVDDTCAFSLRLRDQSGRTGKRKPDDPPTCSRLECGRRLVTVRSEVIVVILPSARWQRVIITALLVVPLLLVVGLSAPTWLVLPFLSEPRRNA